MSSNSAKIKKLINNYRAYNKQNLPYQSIGNIKGVRNTRKRLKILNLPEDFSNKTVLDIGCSTGVFCFEAYKRNARRCVGIDMSHQPINIALGLRSRVKNPSRLDFRVYNINEGLLNLINVIGAYKFDYVFALSIWKHIYDDIFWKLLKIWCKDICFLELNSIHDGHKHPEYLKKLIRSNRKNKKLLRQVILEKSGAKDVKFLGFAKDSGKRACFRIEYS